MLPTGRSGDQQFSAGQKIVGTRALVYVRPEQTPSIEVPFSWNSGAAVRMARPYPELHALAQLHAHVTAVQGIGVIPVRTLPVGLELVGEGVVVEARSRSGQRSKSVRCSERAAIGAEAQLRGLRCPVAGEDLHHAGHRVRPVERALGAPQELQPVGLGQGYSRSIKCAAWVGY